MEIATADPGKRSVGIAGSFSLNTLTGSTNALVNGTATGGQQLSLTANALTVNAQRSGDLFALSASGSGAPGKDGIAIAGSVSINRITHSTQANITGGKTTIATNITLKAEDTSKIFAIGGAVGFGGKAGFGAGIAVNQINNTVKANSHSTVLDQMGALSLSALNHGQIKAITGSLGIAAQQGGIGGAGTVSVNNLTLNTEASLTNTSRTSSLAAATGAITLLAQNQANIASLAGAVGIGNQGGFGAAVAYNGITSNTNAFISGATLATGSTVEIKAEGAASIQSLTLGVGGGRDIGLGGSVAINLIRGGTRAYLNGNASLIAAGQIRLNAIDNSTIEGLAGGIAGSTKAAIGAAISVNDITTSTTSYIEQSSVTSQTAGVSTLAQGNATIRTITVGGAGAGKVAIGGSVAVNLIRNTVDSHIGNSATVNAAQDITLQAIEASTLEAKGGALAGAGT
ncbi:MAG: hypothetical protein HC805_04810, partial [Alkalinema sp. RL_2_19]|nr:hypothetical protein [Alkalinema sp. RL_2_19]